MSATPVYKFGTSSTKSTLKGNILSLAEDTTVNATDLWNVAGGADGSTEHPYEISNVEGLQYLADYVNAGKDCADLNFKLTANIDLNYSEWTPIGINGESPFNGTFDGDNHTISKLKISEGNDNAGLFGINSGTIQNVTLTSVNVTGTSNVGGLAGSNDGGTVDNCIVSGTVTGTGSNAYAGGLVGSNDSGTIKDSISVATVSVGSGSPYGGELVGNNGTGTLTGTNYYYTTPALGGGSISENCTKLYKLTVPTGITVTSGTSKTIDDTTYSAGNVTLQIGTGKAIVNATGIADAAAGTDGNVTITPTADVTITADNIYYSVSGIDGLNVTGGTSKTVSGTTYYAAGSTLTLSSDVDGAIIGAATATGGTITDDDNDGTWTLTTTSAASTVTPTLYYSVNGIDGLNVTGGTSKT
ncbi:MAG: hypothetical protein IKD80_01830, partial [Selenomonadaceae bacterium]|nr:hypothetical protein [Selenomonadaceae bacterium]